MILRGRIFLPTLEHKVVWLGEGTVWRKDERLTQFVVLDTYPLRYRSVIGWSG